MIHEISEGASTRRALDELTESQQDGWWIARPRTARWLYQAFAEGGQTPSRRYCWWRSVLQLTGSDAGVDEHRFLSAVRGPRVRIVPGPAQRVRVADVRGGCAPLRAAEGGPDAGDAWVEERRIFLGERRCRGHARVAPPLEQHMASRLAEESAVLKEKRKGCEERQKARGEVPPSGGDDKAKAARGRGRGRS